MCGLLEASKLRCRDEGNILGSAPADDDGVAIMNDRVA